MPVPDWVPDTIFYQIFPDRFANGDVRNDPKNVQAWGSKPTIHGFQGGDIQGVIDKFDYLLDLGVNAIYFNPIFQSTSNHRYNTTDYFEIDPKLGSVEDFKALLNHAHQKGVRVIVDGVFNHCGRGFFAFNDVMENEQHSAYADWFHINRFPINAYGPGKAQEYEAWWGFRSMPKFNTDNPEVRAYLISVVRYWIEQGADGWRLDVPNEIDDDSFWAEVRGVVKGINSQAYLVGEIWDVNPRWVGEGHFDGLMNYPLRDELIKYLVKGTIKTSELCRNLEGLIKAYPYKHNLAHLLPLSTHDTERLLTVCGGDRKRVRLMNLVQFSFPGVPHIYYGDEIGMEGGKDPDCRRAFAWDESKWDHEQRSFIKSLIQLRSHLPQLRRGNFELIFEDDERGIIIFSRSLDDLKAIIIINGSEKDVQLEIDAVELGFGDGGSIQDRLNMEEIPLKDTFLEITIPALEGKILVENNGR